MKFITEADIFQLVDFSGSVTQRLIISNQEPFHRQFDLFYRLPNFKFLIEKLSKTSGDSLVLKS